MQNHHMPWKNTYITELCTIELDVKEKLFIMLFFLLSSDFFAVDNFVYTRKKLKLLKLLRPCPGRNLSDRFR